MSIIRVSNSIKHCASATITRLLCFLYRYGLSLSDPHQPLVHALPFTVASRYFSRFSDPSYNAEEEGSIETRSNKGNVRKTDLWLLPEVCLPVVRLDLILCFPALLWQLGYLMTGLSRRSNSLNSPNNFSNLVLSL